MSGKYLSYTFDLERISSEKLLFHFVVYNSVSAVVYCSRWLGNSSRGTKRRSENRRYPEERTVVTREKEQKEKAASAARKALFRHEHDGEESFFLLAEDPCMDPTTTYETTPASSFSSAKSNTKVSLSWEAWNAELFPVYLVEFPTSFRESGGHACANASGKEGR